MREGGWAHISAHHLLRELFYLLHGFGSLLLVAHTVQTLLHVDGVFPREHISCTVDLLSAALRHSAVTERIANQRGVSDASAAQARKCAHKDRRRAGPGPRGVAACLKSTSIRTTGGRNHPKRESLLKKKCAKVRRCRRPSPARIPHTRYSNAPAKVGMGGAPATPTDRPARPYLYHRSDGKARLTSDV